ncbi:MAG: SDR family NAD(P)-dependent oxidoreductase [Pseudoxanthomonas sp.]
MTRAVLLQCRARGAVNVMSSVRFRPRPLLSVYPGSKAAVNAFSESLALELAPFNRRACLVLPGLRPARASARTHGSTCKASCLTATPSSCSRSFPACVTPDVR